MTNNYLFLLILLLSLSLLSGSSQGEEPTVVEKITVSGNTVFSTVEITNWMETKISHPLNDSTLARDLARIVQRYAEDSYWDTNVQQEVERREKGRSHESSQGVWLTLTVVEGHQTTVGRITFEGLRAFPDEKIRDLFGIRHGDVPTQRGIEHGIERILKFYEERGYPFCAVHPPRFIVTSSRLIHPTSAVRTITVPMSVSPVDSGLSGEWRGETRDGEEGNVEMNLHASRRGIHSPERDSLGLTIYDAQILDRVDLTLTVDEGPEVRIDAIEIVGNRTTRRYVVTRELGIATGTVYDQRRIDDGYRRLTRSGLFRKTVPPDIRYDTERERFVLIVGVEEGGGGQMDGILGYAPGGIGRRGILTGSVDLTLGNLFGTGRRLALRWGRVEVASSDLRVGYREPWVAGTPLSLEGTLRQTERRGYTRTDLDATVEAPLSSRLTGHLRIGSTSIIPDSVEQTQSGKSRTRHLGIGVTYDTRDHLPNPRQGWFANITTQFGIRREIRGVMSQQIVGERGGNESNRIGRYEANVETLLPTFRQQTLLIGLHGLGILRGETLLPLSEKLRFGGAATLRGYREEAFIGLRVVWGTVEYRYLFSDRSRAFIFIDVGQIDDRRRGMSDSIGVTTLRRVGYGVGVRLDSQAGVIGIDYGLGKGDSFTQGKLHVLLMNQF
ncbi:MAG: BamA/TamA family outer membrane protein [Candidatus Latescibacteria bacterium]|nr:BamA/TamA family outer membrane protein [Candidatus Latescibacterota bacterium]